MAASRVGRKALVLAGGANRGAYQAGVIAGLAAKAGVKDGEPLDYDMVGGASSGGINAYLVATAQYSLLKEVWHGFAANRVFALKKRYAPILAPDAAPFFRPIDMVRRIIAGIQLALGLLRWEKGVVDPDPFWAVIAKYVRPDQPVHIPLYVTTTNITCERAEIFNRRGSTDEGKRKQAVNDELLAGYGGTIVRPIDDAILPRALFATAALPIVFDPIEMPHLEDASRTDEFSDGGMTENLPVDLARFCADHVQVISCDPTIENQNLQKTYKNAVDIGVGMYDTIERRLLRYQLAVVFGEHVGEGQRAARYAQASGLTVGLLAPNKTMPGQYGDFNDVNAMDGMYEIGRQDGAAGFLPLASEPTAAPAAP